MTADGRVRSLPAHRGPSALGPTTARICTAVALSAVSGQRSAVRNTQFLGKVSSHLNSTIRRYNSQLTFGYSSAKIMAATVGGMAEWSIAVVLKTIEAARSPGVRIPLPPLI